MDLASWAVAWPPILPKQAQTLTVYNRSINQAQALEPLGANIAHSPAEAVQNADVVFSMLSTPEVVQQIAFGEEGILGQMKEGALWVDCTTVNPSFSRTELAEATTHGLRFLEAPVAGTKPHAENAELVFFVGGEEAELEQVRGMMEKMGRKIVHVGKAGMGSSLKMLINGMLAQSMLMFSESVVLGEKLGLDREFLLDFLPNLVVSAPFTQIQG